MSTVRHLSEICQAMKRNRKYIGLAVVVAAVGIFAVYHIIDAVQSGSVVSGKGLHKVTGHDATEDLREIGKVPSFELTNQDGRKITNKDFEGKVYVLEFFFSTCPTICPKMNQNMLKIEKAFFGNPNFGIASITINPSTDTPEVLKKHATDLGVKSANWHFLTGEQDYIMNLSNKGFNLYAAENGKVNGGFEHSGMFALIDKKGMIRSRSDEFNNPIIYYDGLEANGIAALINDIKLLLRE